MPSIVLVDDHSLVRTGLAALVESLGYTVLFEADNGNEFIEKLKDNKLPDIVLMDINMPELDGYETTLWLKNKFPRVLVLALTMYDTEIAIIRMLKCGAKGYILKDCKTNELKMAIASLLSKGYYCSDLVGNRLFHFIDKSDDEVAGLEIVMNLNEKQIQFLKYTCSELSYKEIADKMFLSPRTIEGYRDALFEKLNVNTRVGLVMYAIKNSIVTL